MDTIEFDEQKLLTHAPFAVSTQKWYTERGCRVEEVLLSSGNRNIELSMPRSAS